MGEGVSLAETCPNADDSADGILIPAIVSSPIDVTRQDRQDGAEHTEDPCEGAADASEIEESEEAYRLRVYGTTDAHDSYEPRRSSRYSRSSSSASLLARRISEQFSQEVLERRRSSIVETLPDTPQGWVAFVSAITAAFVGYEVQLQRHLTCPPLIYGQFDPNIADVNAEDGDSREIHALRGPLQEIYDTMTTHRRKLDHDNKTSPSEVDRSSILLRPIQPSLFVGTRSLFASTAAYLFGGPSTSTENFLRFREFFTMTQDGGTIAIDWELPAITENSPEVNQTDTAATLASDQSRIDSVQSGPITQPVVLILHGINNDSSFGYVRSLMRACTKRGWLAAGMNFRGCGGVKLSTPRSYNGAFTGDIRCVVHRLASRIGQGGCIFIVGNSLGANLVTKYLGEEGLSGTLPEAVVGAVALGNPLTLDSRKIDWLYSPVMAMGLKKSVIQNWLSLRHMKNPEFRNAMKNAMAAPTVAHFDEAMASVFIRNDTTYPFAVNVGFEDGRHYWTEASSFRYAQHITVPTLQVIAGDDFLIFHPFRGKLRYCLTNPNIMVIETKCGGHLGWQENPPDGSRFGLGSSWADIATTDFIAAVLDRWRQQRNGINSSARSEGSHNSIFLSKL